MIQSPPSCHGRPRPLAAMIAATLKTQSKYMNYGHRPFGMLNSISCVTFSFRSDQTSWSIPALLPWPSTSACRNNVGHVGKPICMFLDLLDCIILFLLSYYLSLLKIKPSKITIKILYMEDTPSFTVCKLHMNPNIPILRGHNSLTFITILWHSSLTFITILYGTVPLPCW